jgi:hypothetical protein
VDVVRTCGAGSFLRKRGPKSEIAAAERRKAQASLTGRRPCREARASDDGSAERRSAPLGCPRGRKRTGKTGAARASTNNRAGGALPIRHARDERGHDGENDLRTWLFDNRIGSRDAPDLRTHDARCPIAIPIDVGRAMV